MTYRFGCFTCGVLALIGAGVGASGCGNLGTHPACDLSAASSVMIEIVDTDGEPLMPDAVTFTIDGSDPEEAMCVDEACTTWTAGVEQTGEFVILAELCGGSAEETVTVEPGACHVVGQEVTIELDSALCDTTD